MNDKLHNLPNILEEGVFKGQRFTKESKKIVRNRINKPKKYILPSVLTIVAACGFFGLGAFYIAKETGFLQDEPLHTSNENIPPTVEAPLDFDLNGNLPPDQPLLITDELINSLSLPLDIQSVVPSISSKPTIFARTLSEGYSISLTFPGDGYEVNITENVEPPEDIEHFKNTRTRIWPDEKELKINGYDAYYSPDQKEMHLFTHNKYFVLFGLKLEDEQLIKLAQLIDTDKPVKPIDLEVYEDAYMDPVEVTDIKQKVYLSSDFHKNVEFLKDSTGPFITAEKNETAFTVRLGFAAPNDGSELMIEQHYNEQGNQYKIEKMYQEYNLVREIELNDRKIFLFSNGSWQMGFFTYENNLFEVRAMNSVSLEHIQEILSAIDLTK